VVYLIILLPLALILVSFQASVLNQLTLAGGHLDIIIISLVMLTLYGSYEIALLAAVLIAPLMDALAGMPLGVSIIPLMSVVSLTHWIGKTLFGTRLGWPVVAIFIGSFLAGLITMAELALLRWDLPWNEIILKSLLPSTFLNAAAAIIIYLPIIIFSERRYTHL